MSPKVHSMLLGEPDNADISFSLAPKPRNDSDEAKAQQMLESYSLLHDKRYLLLRHKIVGEQEEERKLMENAIM